MSPPIVVSSFSVPETSNRELGPKKFNPNSLPQHLDLSKCSCRSPLSLLAVKIAVLAGGMAALVEQAADERVDTVAAKEAGMDESFPLGHIMGCCALPGCMISAAPNVKLQKCGACSEVSYCSREHQVEHFKSGGHKHLCKGRKDPSTSTDFAVFDKRAQDAMKKRDWKKAIMALGCMLELTEKHKDIFHPQNAKILGQMASIYQQMDEIDKDGVPTKDYKRAIMCLQRMVIVQDFNNPNNKPELTEESFKTMGKLAQCYVMSGQCDLAVTLLKKTEQEVMSNFGEESYERGMILTTMSNPLFTLEKEDEAIEALRKAISLEGYTVDAVKDSAKKLGISDAYFNLGHILAGKGEKEEAKAAYKGCLRAKLAGGLPVSHPDVKEIDALVKAF